MQSIEPAQAECAGGIHLPAEQRRPDPRPQAAAQEEQLHLLRDGGQAQAAAETVQKIW